MTRKNQKSNFDNSLKSEFTRQDIARRKYKSRMQKKRELQKLSVSTLKNKLIYARTPQERRRYRKQIKVKESQISNIEKSNLKRFGTKYPYSKKNYARTQKILKKERLAKEKKEKEEEQKKYFDNEQVSHTTYVNFYIAKTNGYVRGYIVTSKVMPIETLKELCIHLISSRHPRLQIQRFEVAKESGIINYSRFVLFRGDDQIDSLVLNL